MNILDDVLEEERSPIDLAGDQILSELLDNHFSSIEAFASATGRNSHHMMTADNAREWVHGATPGAQEKLIETYPLPGDLQEKLNLAAVANDPHSIRSIPQAMLTEDVCIAAAGANGISLHYMPDNLKTDAVCMASASGNNPSLSSIPPEKRTEDICLEALKNPNTHSLLGSATGIDSSERKHVPPELQADVYAKFDKWAADAFSQKQSQEMPNAGLMLTEREQGSLRTEMADDLQKIQALHQGSEAVAADVHELTTASEAQRLEAVREDGLNLQYIPVDQQSQDVQIEAVLQNEQALNYVPDDAAEDVLREASLRADEPVAIDQDVFDPRVDFENASYQELSYREDSAPVEDYDFYFDGEVFDPMRADHLEEFKLIVKGGEVYLDFYAVDLDGNEQKHSMNEAQILAMEDSPFKELVNDAFNGSFEDVTRFRERIALDNAKAEGIDGTPIEEISISGTSGYDPMATVKSVGSNEAMQIPLSPETLKPIHQEHQHLEDLIALQVKEEGATPAGDMLQAKLKANELADLIKEPVNIIERDNGFEIEVGDSDSKKTIMADSLTSVNQHLDKEISHERERSEVIDVPKEHYGTQHDISPEPESPEIHHQQEVDQERKRSVGI